MKLLFNPFFFFLLYVSLVVGQTEPCTHSVKGKILDVETKYPIPYATVKVRDTDKYAISDENGDFIITDLCSKNNTLVISCIGYADSKKEHDHDSEIHFYLTQEVTGLSEVTIQAERRKEKGTETISQVAIGKGDIVNNPTQTLAGALAAQEGVSFAATGTNVQLPIIHGLSGNRILILNNGLKHGFQNWGNDHAPEIDISAAHKIIIIKGAAGVRYGPEALGGAIIVESNPLLLENPFYANIGTGYQTNGKGYNANFELGKGSKNWSYYLSGSYAKIGDRNTPDYNLTNSGKEENGFSFGVLKHLKKWDIKLKYSLVNQNLGLLRTAFATSSNAFIDAVNSDRPRIIEPFSYDINDPKQTIQHHLAVAEINWWYSDEAKLTFRGGAQLNKRDEFDVRRNAEAPIIDLDLFTYDYQLEWKHPKWKNLDGLIGAQYFSQNSDNNPGTLTTPFIPNYNINRSSLFVSENLKFGKNALEAGARLDFETNDVRGRETNQDIFRDNYNFTNLTVSLGYVRKLNANSTFRTNIGTAWRTPNVFELFSFGQQGVESIFGLLRFNDDNGTPSTSEIIPFTESTVEPEKGYKFVNEFETYHNGNSHKLTVYSHFIDNYIFNRPIGVFRGVRGPNLALIVDQADGLFIGADYTWKNQWSKKISSTYGLSYLWSKNIGKNGPLINQPPISTNFKLEWDQGDLWFLDASKLSLKSSYTFEQFQAPRTISPESLADGSVVVTSSSEIFDFLDAPNGYFLLDLAYNFKWKNLNGSISANNLLNTRYRNYLNDVRYFADEPGRNILVTLNYSFKSKK